MIAILFALLAALAWGGSDFSGGIASRRIGAAVAVFLAEIIGMMFLLIAIPLVKEPIPSISILLISLGIGAIGSYGLMLLYQAMMKGQMSIAAPVSALLAAFLPVLVDIFIEGMPGILKFAGFAGALAAIWLISQEDNHGRTHLNRLTDLHLPLLAGLGFGIFFILMHQVSQQAILWPIIGARIGGLVFMLIFVLARGDSFHIARNVWPYIAVNAILDLGGSLFYILAGQAGRMDVAAVLSSLYPGATVFLAWIILKERINRPQTIGIFVALVSIVLMLV